MYMYIYVCIYRERERERKKERERERERGWLLLQIIYIMDITWHHFVKDKLTMPWMNVALKARKRFKSLWHKIGTWDFNLWETISICDS